MKNNNLDYLIKICNKIRISFGPFFEYKIIGQWKVARLVFISKVPKSADLTRPLQEMQFKWYIRSIDIIDHYVTNKI